MSLRTVVVVPCYNEAERLNRTRFIELSRAREGLSLRFVDDESKDATRAVIEDLAANEAGIEALSLENNRGKAEAVRAGMQAALADGAEVVGYLDADLATPPSEMLRLLDALVEHDVSGVLGSRLKRLGSHIERSSARHYLGRIFATVVSTGLDLGVYDSQCGAKLFRDGAALRHALEQPFSSRWAFDVELLGRLLTAPDAPLSPEDLLEVPLEEWTHVAGSKLRPTQMLGAGLDLMKVLSAYRRRRIVQR